MKTTTYPSYPSSIESAAKLLDIRYSGWATKINILQLRMDEPRRCILGQIYDGYVNGMKTLFEQYEPNKRGYGDDTIFGTKANKNEWTNEIQQRLEDNRPTIKIPSNPILNVLPPTPNNVTVTTVKLDLMGKTFYDVTKKQIDEAIETLKTAQSLMQ